MELSILLNKSSSKGHMIMAEAIKVNRLRKKYLTVLLGVKIDSVLVSFLLSAMINNSFYDFIITYLML